MKRFELRDSVGGWTAQNYRPSGSLKAATIEDVLIFGENIPPAQP